MAWLIVVILLLLGILYFLFFTPYPFVLLLKLHKEEKKEKGPENIQELSAQTHMEKDISYPSSYPNHTYDYYQHKTMPPTCILIWVHGGSFIAGTSEGAKNFAIQMAQEGCVVCAINYAYAPQHAFPDQIKQIDEFLAYLPEIRKQHHLSHLPIFIGGDSAGANLAAMYACVQTHPTLADEIKFTMQNTQRIQGCLLFCGPYNFCEDVNQPEFKSFAKFFHFIGWSYLGHKHWQKRQEKVWASPLQHISDAFPPSYITDGKNFSFLWQGKQLVEKINEVGVPVYSRFYEDMPHEFQFEYQAYPEQANAVLQDSITFINQYTEKGETYAA